MKTFDFFISKSDASLNGGNAIHESTFNNWCGYWNDGIFREGSDTLCVDFETNVQKYKWSELLVAHIELPDEGFPEGIIDGKEEGWTVPVSYREVTEEDKAKVGAERHRNLL